MDVYKIDSLNQVLAGNSYPGRGIVVGKSEDGKSAVFAYFIMGRSENSRNRVFVENDDDVTIYPFDESKVEDPSLIIYSPVRRYKNSYIVTNGDQTDTVYDGLKDGKCFTRALKSRCFEPDAPNFTPRISAILNLDDEFYYKMSILKSATADGAACNRYAFDYAPIAGLGHFIHTYNCDGNPIPTFTGEPERVAIGNDIDEFANGIWNNLNDTNKVSAYVAYIDLASGEKTARLFNKHSK